jgi:hypothetical protein
MRIAPKQTAGWCRLQSFAEQIERPATLVQGKKAVLRLWNVAEWVDGQGQSEREESRGFR